MNRGLLPSSILSYCLSSLGLLSHPAASFLHYQKAQRMHPEGELGVGVELAPLQSSSSSSLPIQITSEHVHHSCRSKISSNLLPISSMKLLLFLLLQALAMALLLLPFHTVHAAASKTITVSEHERHQKFHG